MHWAAKHLHKLVHQVSRLSWVSINTEWKCFTSGSDNNPHCCSYAFQMQPFTKIPVGLLFLSGTLTFSCPTFSFILSAVPPCDMTILERVSNTTPDVSGKKKENVINAKLHYLLRSWVCLQSAVEHHLQSKTLSRHFNKRFPGKAFRLRLWIPIM